jgi:hypothetical protein
MMQRILMVNLSSCSQVMEPLEEEDGGEGLEEVDGGANLMVLKMVDLLELGIEAVAADDGAMVTEHVAKKGNVDSSEFAGLLALFSCACG